MQLLEWMALGNRIDADVCEKDAEYQARWAYFDIFGIDPYRFRYPDHAIPEDRRIFRADVLLYGRSKGRA
eukprot:11184786-Lingulodinium_polyedra.AAC.1